MKLTLKSLLKVILKISFCIVVILAIPVSVLLVLEYVSPKLNIFPLYTITAVSVFWVGLFLIPFLLTNSRNSQSLVLNGNQMANPKPILKFHLQLVRKRAAGVGDFIKKLTGKLKFGSKQITNSQPSNGRLTKQNREPVGIFLMFDDNETIQAKASVANVSVEYERKTKI